MESAIQLKGQRPIIYHPLNETILPINPSSLKKGVISYDGENHLMNYDNKVVLYSVEENNITIYGFLHTPKKFDGRSEDDVLESKVSLFGLDLLLKKIMKKSLEDMMKKGLLNESTGNVDVHTVAGIRFCEYDIFDDGDIHISCKDIKED